MGLLQIDGLVTVSINCFEEIYQLVCGDLSGRDMRLPGESRELGIYLGRMQLLGRTAQKLSKAPAKAQHVQCQFCPVCIVPHCQLALGFAAPSIPSWLHGSAWPRFAPFFDT